MVPHMGLHLSGPFLTTATSVVFENYRCYDIAPLFEHSRVPGVLSTRQDKSQKLPPTGEWHFTTGPSSAVQHGLRSGPLTLWSFSNMPLHTPPLKSSHTAPVAFFYGKLLHIC